MQNRRRFLWNAILGGFGIGLLNSFKVNAKPNEKRITINKPLVISTWRFGLEANAIAWKILSENGWALDAVEMGVKHVEDDPKERSVGLGGRPDRDGKVTLDACIMDEKSNIGSVACLQNIKNPISVARKVMESTPHVMLCAEGALQFALEMGFIEENLLTSDSELEWEDWKKQSQYLPKVNIENHDTIGMLALDNSGRLSGACTTSGMAYKMHGRIGDSPIIGAGLYVDGEVGAATASGHGEEIIRITGSHLVVELMRNGLSPKEACKEAVLRISNKFKIRAFDKTHTQIGFLAVDRFGNFGAFALKPGFNYAVYEVSGPKLLNAEYLEAW